MYGNYPIGIYPLLENDTCFFLSLDFDDKDSKKDIKSDVLAFASVCDKYEVPIAIERSRSGNGIHIWMFFDTNIKAITARKLGSLLLSKLWKYQIFQFPLLIECFLIKIYYQKVDMVI